jgi:hypothetical protein
MHSSGSIIKTYCEKVRHYLDDPDLDAKYDDNYLVRFFLSSAMSDVISRVSMMSDAQITASITVTVAAGTQYYKLPPSVRQVLRVGITDTASGLFVEDYKPRNEFSMYGPGWSLEGNLLAFKPIPTEARDFTILFVPSGDVGVHYDTAGGVLNANGTFTMDATPVIGSVEKRDNAYIGSYLRILGTTVTDELVIKDHDAATRILILRNVASNAAGSYASEVVPFIMEPLVDAISISAAMRTGVGRKITAGHQQSLLLAYRQAIKTSYDTLGNMNARVGKRFSGESVDNRNLQGF